MRLGVKVFILSISLAITACGANQAAPIVNGWQQPSVNQSYYVVQKGDTLYSIAWAFDMDYRTLASINHLKLPYDLHAGQRLSMGAATGRTIHRVIPVPGQSTKKSHVKLPLLSPKAINNNQRVSYTSLPSPGRIQISKGQVSKQVVKKPQALIAKPFNGKHWLWPAKGKIVKSFSMLPGGCKGIDIAGKLGEPVVATAPGEVVYSGSGLRGYGNLIIIKHSSSYLSAYAFNKTLLVKESDTVKAGQKIALMGSDNAGKVMLHFEIRRDGKPANPVQFLTPNFKGVLAVQ
jgi:lipoprotein NlpD